MEKKSKLGKGLSALISSNTTNDLDEKIKKIAINFIKPNPSQPRKEFNSEEIDKLGESIKTHGIIQPIIVRRDPNKENQYILIAGERRLRASKNAGLKELPAIIREVTEQDNLELAIIENIQRENLNAIEEATAFKQLANEYNLTQEEIAKKVSKSRSAITNAIRLLELPKEIQKMLQEKKISVSHAKLLLVLESDKQMTLAEIIIKKQLSVRELENKIKKISLGSTIVQNQTNKDPDIQNLEEKLVKIFGTEVKINLKNEESGNIRISFYSLDEFEGILEKLNFKKDVE